MNISITKIILFFQAMVLSLVMANALAAPPLQKEEKEGTRLMRYEQRLELKAECIAGRDDRRRNGQNDQPGTASDISKCAKLVQSLPRKESRMTPEERRTLRRQINEAGQDIYANPPKY